MDFLEAVEKRRSYYGISSESTISDEKIKQIVEHSVKHCPSAFNSQTARVVILLKEEHKKLWDITKDSLKKIVPEASFSETEEKINSFKNGYGTILFFENMEIVEALQEQFALYKDNFPVWSQQSSGMCQFIVWTAIETEGLGASLQHYNELIEAQVKSEWNISKKWKLIAQMPFGKPTFLPDEKQFEPIENRVFVY